MTRLPSRRVLCLAWLLLAVFVIGARITGILAQPRGAPFVLAFWPVFVLVAEVVSTVVHAIGSATVAAILFAWNVLRSGVALLARAAKSGLWDAGRFISKAWTGIRALWDKVLRPVLGWVNDKLIRLEAWLHDTFAPVLRWLAKIKKWLDDFYTTYVRPITDTIDMVRALNRALEAIHIHVLSGLDKFLLELEERLEAPILFLRRVVTEIENVIDRIITADGFFQRLTLLRSMAKHAPPWINGFWNRQLAKDVTHGTEYDRTRDYPLDEAHANGLELGRFYRGEDNRMSAAVALLVPLWREAAGIDPPGSSAV